MKRLIILVPILLIASLGLMTASAERITDPARLLPTPEQPAGITEVDPNTKTTPKPQVEADPLADPNKIEAAIKAFEGLQTELDKVTGKSTEETRQWQQREHDNRINLAKSVHEQVMAEIMLIRKLAVEEGAKKTTAAIDGLLLNRQNRLENLIEKLQEERREERRQLRREQTTRGRQRPRQRTQQDRRTRGRQLEEEQYDDTQERSRSRRR